VHVLGVLLVRNASHRITVDRRGKALEMNYDIR
jgi:hypothetical protein